MLAVYHGTSNAAPLMIFPDPLGEALCGFDGKIPEQFQGGNEHTEKTVRFNHLEIAGINAGQAGSNYAEYACRPKNLASCATYQ